MIRKIITLLFTSFISCQLVGQSINDDKTSITNFIKRMYALKPFEGVKIIEDYDQQYLISVVSLEKAKYTNESIMNRVAQVKAQSQASTYFNGASISMDIVITTKESKDSLNNSKTMTETYEQIKQNSEGFTQGLELLINFENKDNLKMIFVFGRKIIK